MENKLNITKASSIYVEDANDLPAPVLPAPPEGKVYRRKSDGVIFYGATDLGKVAFLNGKKLKTPIQETPEDFELVDIEEEKSDIESIE